jgi:FkbM family methyltransferase
VKVKLRGILEQIGLSKRRHQAPKRAEIFKEFHDFCQYILEKNGGKDSKAQLSQDILALIENGFKREGYFVEFGATDGVGLSNTHLLEKEFGWRGILAEPAHMWHAALVKNRNCSIETNCVWSKSNETLSFDMTNEGELSTISSFRDKDSHAKSRKQRSTYDVKTISLLDLLKKYEAPANIDYISIDTEGSEFEILKDFDFSAYRFNLITVEHNYSSTREPLQALFEKNGYRRIFSHLSQWDDWYVPIKGV